MRQHGGFKRIFAHYVLGKLGFLGILFFLCHPGSQATFCSKDYLSQRYPNLKLLATSAGHDGGAASEATKRVLRCKREASCTRRKSTEGAASHTVGSVRGRHSVAFVAAPSLGTATCSSVFAARTNVAFKPHRPWHTCRPVQDRRARMLFAGASSSSSSSAHALRAAAPPLRAPPCSTPTARTTDARSPAAVTALHAVSAGSGGGGGDRYDGCSYFRGDSGGSSPRRGALRRARGFLGGLRDSAQDVVDDAFGTVGHALVTHPLGKLLLPPEGPRSSGGGGGARAAAPLTAAAAATESRERARLTSAAYDLVGFMDVDIHRGFR
ncbi:hypothetical protein JKP88DRAFT_314140 [Tribonema minus]|uniref:Uncharacterized protein n=1 Tax=Tribonema minus TaxID=303371 RepID=A0A836CID3_9STRA|nr:hypothetical protein JKP88DRAFT_314140 [Tribonema minus]